MLAAPCATLVLSATPVTACSGADALRCHSWLIRWCLHQVLVLQEQKNKQLGQLFAYSALIQAGTIERPEDANAVAAALLALAAKRPFMAESCTAAVIDLLESLEQPAQQQLVSGCTQLQEMLFAPASDASPEMLQLALYLWPLLPAEDVQRCALLPDNAPAPSPSLFACAAAHQYSKQDAEAAAAFFAPQHLAQLADIARQTSACLPRLHAAWLYMLRLLLPGFQLRVAAEATPQPQSSAGCAPTEVRLCHAPGQPLAGTLRCGHMEIYMGPSCRPAPGVL